MNPPVRPTAPQPQNGAAKPLYGAAPLCGVGYVVTLFLIGLQVFTGVLLMTVYSPSTTTAWSSVWYIQTQVPGGWLIRGVHIIASDTLLVVLVLQALWIVVRWRRRAALPRRFAVTYRARDARVWWITLALLGLALGLSLSGHLLPWDQDAYWGTKVRTNILALTPVIGDAMRRLLVGGSEFGHLTLTRFYTLHVMILPGLMGLVIYVAARRGCRGGERPDESPPRNGRLPAALACALVLAVVFAIAGYCRHVVGTELLDAPADPMASDYPARPEWHTLFLYQGLKYFEGPAMEVVGAIVIPTLVVAVFFAFPLLGCVFKPRVAHAIALLITTVTVIGVLSLSFAGILADADPPASRVAAIEDKRQRQEPLSETEESVMRARLFNRQRDRARRAADRAIVLAGERGIPPEGPLALLANDALTRGPVLFAAHCASCHRFHGHNGLNETSTEPATSSDLGGYASRVWIRGLLANPMDKRYFGLMTKSDGEPAHTRMARWVREMMGEHESADDRKAARRRRELLEDFQAVAAYLEDESLAPGRLAHVPAKETGGGSDDPGARAVPPPGALEPQAEALLLRGRRYFMSVCNECHSYNGERSGTLKAPEMFGYGSVAWIELMIREPSHPTRYRSRGREPAQMPAFGDRLSERDRRLIAQWLHDARDGLGSRAHGEPVWGVDP